MSWSFSPGLVAAFSEAHCSDTEPSALSSATPTPDQYYWPDKPTEHSRLSRFGMMCEPLTADRGAQLLTWYLAGSLARTSASQETKTGSTVSDPASGEKWRGSFAKYDPVSCEWKTHQHSLLGGLEPFLETWPRWGLMRAGESYLRPTPERSRAVMRELVTPEELTGPLNPAFPEWLMGWPTGWTDLKPLAMDRLAEWQQQHGNF